MISKSLCPQLLFGAVQGTVYRQNMFAEFERIVHGMAESGEPLTVESLSDAYYKLNLKYYGPDMVVDDEIALEWAGSPLLLILLCIQVCNRFCRSSSLAQRILDEGRRRWIVTLTSCPGRSDYPIELLKDAGVDMTSPNL